jgi:hypothetical protein
VLNIKSDLYTLGTDINALAKESIVKTAKMSSVAAELKRIEQQVNMYQVIKTENLNKTKPEFSMKFDYPSVAIKIPHSANAQINESLQTDTKEPSSETNPLNIPHQPSVTQEYSKNQPRENDDIENEDKSSGTASNGNNIKHVDHRQTSYNVDLMASDGENILYTSYYDEERDIIAYCIMDDSDGNGDKCRDWKQSCIKDMIWWNSIDKFICATEDAIYSVEYINGRFKILSHLRGSWSYVRVATNIAHLFLWLNSTVNGFNGIEVHSIHFACVRTIDFNSRQIGSFVDQSASFCMTDNRIASICTRTQNNCQVFKLIFCDLKMNELNSVLLGECEDDTEIRSDGKDRFFITTGQRQFYIVRSDGTKTMINLGDNARCIAVLHDRRIAISNGFSNIQLVSY